MEETFFSRFKNAWNAFRGRDPTETENFKIDFGSSSSYRPDIMRFSRGNARSIVTTIYNRLAMDCAAINVMHVKVDKDENYQDTIKSGLNNCLTLDANIDQTGPALIQDTVMSMFDEGCVAVVPVDTDIDPRKSDSYDILSMRTAKIVQWYPGNVKVNVYNERDGKHHDLIMDKKEVAIIENPLYSIMNEPNSTLQRLIKILHVIDKVNGNMASNRLDLIIQLPYTVRNERKEQQAEGRRKAIEQQLTNSKYGIAYTDGTERITQLNRPIENNLWSQAMDLTNQLYNQLGLTESIFNGTADEKTMLNYYNRTIAPILNAITLEMTRKFLTKTGRTQGQRIKFFRDPFKLVPVDQLAEIADKFTRNEIMTANEIRSKVGLKPADDPTADELRNKNLNPTAETGDEMNRKETTNDEEKEEL